MHALGPVPDGTAKKKSEAVKRCGGPMPPHVSLSLHSYRFATSSMLHVHNHVSHGGTPLHRRCIVQRECNTPLHRRCIVVKRVEKMHVNKARRCASFEMHLLFYIEDVQLAPAYASLCIFFTRGVACPAVHVFVLQTAE